MNSTAPGKYLMLIVTALLVVGAYWQGLGGPLILDDFHNIGAYFDSETLTSDKLLDKLHSSSGRLGRPVSMTSFTASYFICNDSVWCWKLHNLLIHIACSLLIFGLLKNIIQSPQVQGKSLEKIPGLIAVLWLLHPLHVSTVLYLVQRMTQLSALFVLAGLYVYTSIRLRHIKYGHGLAGIWLVIPVFVLLAAFSKENGVLLLPLLLVVELVIFRFSCSEEAAQGFRRAFGVLVLFPMLAGFVILALNSDSLVLNAYHGREFTLVERLLTQPRILFEYIVMILIPQPSSMRFFYEGYEYSKSLLNPISTLTSMTGVLLLLVYAWRKRLSRPLTAFGIFLFFIGHGLESGFFALELAFEHRNYLPMLGIIVVAVDFLDDRLKNRFYRYTAVILAVLVLSFATLSRAEQWSSRTSLYNYLYKINPESQRLKSILAEELTGQGKYRLALNILSGSHANGAVLQRMYVECKREGEVDLDMLGNPAIFTNKIVDSYMLTGIIQLANMGLDDECTFDRHIYVDFLESLSEFNFSDEKNKSKVLIYAGHYHWLLDDPESAFSVVEKSVRVSPDDPMPLYLASEWALELHAPVLAGDYFARAEKISSGRSKYNDISDRVSKLLRSYKD